MTKKQSRGGDWSVQSAKPLKSGARRAASAGPVVPPEFLTASSTVAEEFAAEPKPGRRDTASAVLDLSYDLKPGEAAVLVLRHPSGALTFHVPVESSRRSDVKAGGSQVRFAVPIRPGDGASGGRRGAIAKVVKGALIKVAGAVVDQAAGFLLPKLAAAYEKAAWQKKGLAEGWHLVSRDSLLAGKLVPGKPESSERALLFLHGTFSNAASAYHGLASSDFFDRVAPLYGGRIFAFDHFSISRTPEENVRMLLEGLPDHKFSFDVITHSRGGLVLRSLAERSANFGELASRFQLGRAVLVAAPNDGTPLATPARWQDTVGWFANLLELFPDNPFTTGTEFVANAIVWLARHASGDLPGLHSMDSGGDLIGDLQSPPGPPMDAYSALVSNHHPDAAVLQRMVDAGVDQFFGTANDLVVPTEGGWRIDRSGITYIPSSRIGCFGPGGNLAPATVTHVNFFSQPATVDFLVNALSGRAQPITPIDPTRPLPDRRFLRSAAPAPAVAAAEPEPAAGPAVAPIAAPGQKQVITVGGSLMFASDTFYITVLPRFDSDKRQSQMLATYGSARVLEDFYLGGTNDNAGKRWASIIANQERIKKYVDGGDGSMPSEEELQKFGQVLFETLFPGRVRRLYDTARSIQGNRRLDLIFTSEIPWVAEKPWEFAYDPARRTFLATEELHFVRNVITAIPAEVINDRQDVLRILVATAQPLRLGKLSLEEEEAVIRRGFEPLREAGLAEVEVLSRATPASLHGYISTGRFAVVHFIGHGKYDAAAGRGYLMFQDAQGNEYPVDERSMREILCQRGIRMVFLNACETGMGGHADFNSGVAPALVAGGVPIVVANQYKVLDASATFFAQHLYWSIAHGMAIGAAVREARIAVNYSMTGESIDWAVPVIYARDPQSRLCEARPIDRRTMPSPSVRASARRATREHEVRIAVWDVNGQFPRLRQTLERINSAQRFYGFEVVDLSVPMDSWHKHKGIRYLDADRFAERVAPQIAQVGADYFCVMVDELLARDLKSDQPQYDIYEWRPREGQPPVLIFSTKDLELEPKGEETDRAIANQIVANTAGNLSVKAHQKGPRDCPNNWNTNHDAKIITGTLKFCVPCEAVLQKTYAEELKALKAILQEFD